MLCIPKQLILTDTPDIDKVPPGIKERASRVHLGGALACAAVLLLRSLQSNSSAAQNN
jgi:hypothetical protein